MSDNNKQIQSELICGLFLLLTTNNLFDENKEIN